MGFQRSNNFRLVQKPFTVGVDLRDSQILIFFARIYLVNTTFWISTQVKGNCNIFLTFSYLKIHVYSVYQWEVMLGCKVLEDDKRRLGRLT